MLRIMASSEGTGDEPFRMKPCLMTAPGVYNEEIFCGLDYLMDALSKRGFTAIGNDIIFHVWEYSSHVLSIACHSYFFFFSYVFTTVTLNNQWHWSGG